MRRHVIAHLTWPIHRLCRPTRPIVRRRLHDVPGPAVYCQARKATREAAVEEIACRQRTWIGTFEPTPAA
jgi:hypothetical protein